MIKPPDPKNPYANLPEGVQARLKALEDHYGRQMDDIMVRLSVLVDDDEMIAMNKHLGELKKEYLDVSGTHLQNETNLQAMKNLIKTESKILLKKLDHAADAELNKPNESAKIPALTGAKNPEDAREILRLMTPRNRPGIPADRLTSEELRTTIADDVLPAKKSTRRRKKRES